MSLYWLIRPPTVSEPHIKVFVVDRTHARITVGCNDKRELRRLHILGQPAHSHSVSAFIGLKLDAIRFCQRRMRGNGLLHVVAAYVRQHELVQLCAGRSGRRVGVKVRRDGQHVDVLVGVPSKPNRFRQTLTKRPAQRRPALLACGPRRIRPLKNFEDFERALRGQSAKADPTDVPSPSLSD